MNYLKAGGVNMLPSLSFSLFLTVMGVLFFIFPVAGGMGFGATFFKGAFFALSISCIYMVSHRVAQTLVAVFLAMPGIFLTLSTDSFEYSSIEFAGLISNLILYGYVIYIMGGYLRRQKVVDRNIISGAICLYLLLGLVWSFLYMIIELIYPHSFSGIYESDTIDIKSISQIFSHLFYYSYVTLTTLGYGSISPRSVVASSFASAEAITGQLYVSIFIARLVGLHTAQELRGESPLKTPSIPKE